MHVRVDTSPVIGMCVSSRRAPLTKYQREEAMISWLKGSDGMTESIWAVVGAKGSTV